MKFRQKFDGVAYVRENIFPYTEREADRQSKDLWKAGFRVQVTEEPKGEFYVWRA